MTHGSEVSKPVVEVAIFFRVTKNNLEQLDPLLSKTNVILVRIKFKSPRVRANVIYGFQEEKFYKNI